MKNLAVSIKPQKNKKEVVKTFRLNITPRTYVRVVFGDRIFFRIPRSKLRPEGLKRLERIEQYNDYKLQIAAEAKRIGFTMPEQGAHVTFYIPVSKSWRKHKKESFHLKLHQERPDADNLYKSLSDSLLEEDKSIADIRITKKWVNSDKGWIDITVATPLFRSQDVLI